MLFNFFFNYKIYFDKLDDILFIIACITRRFKHVYFWKWMRHMFQNTKHFQDIKLSEDIILKYGTLQYNTERMAFLFIELLKYY